MKFGIDCGHNCPPDTGCNGVRLEDNLTHEVGALVKQKLLALGHEVVNCNPSSAESVTHSLRQRVNTANNANVDLYVSIHFDCFNSDAHGTGTFAISSTGKKYAQQVVDEIAAKFGFVNRGVKDASHLYVVKNTMAPALLIECCFCDSARDMQKYDAEKMAAAIVRGLTK
jgi:N-acetylmuramoyl-L-alanine amidase